MRSAMAGVVGLLLAASTALAGASESGFAAKNRQAWEAFQRRDFPRAEALARQAWTAAGPQTDPSQAAIAAVNVGAALALRGRLEEALEWSHRGEERLGTGGDKVVRGRVLASRALIRFARGEQDESRADFERAEALLGADDWRFALARTLTRVYVEVDAAAAQELETMLAQARRSGGDPVRVVPCLMGLGWLEGLYGSGASRFEEMRRVLEGRADDSVLALVDHDLAAVHLRGGRLEGAEAAVRRGLETARRAGDLRLEFILLNDQSLLHVQKKEDAAARESDRAAQQSLVALTAALREGRLEDSLLLDFRQLARLRYINQPLVLGDPFLGVMDQVALDPAKEVQ
jgi:ATP/maltotriose-dependent transcriptional regulator MalT